MSTSNQQEVRVLPNGMKMKDSQDDGKDYYVKKVLGTRCRNAMREFLILFWYFDMLEWVAETGCGGCPKAIKTFMKQMKWTEFPMDDGTERLHPSLLVPSPVTPRTSTASSVDSQTIDVDEAHADSRIGNHSTAISSVSSSTKSNPGSGCWKRARASSPATSGIATPKRSAASSAGISTKNDSQPSITSAEDSCSVLVTGEPIGAFDIASYAEAVKRGAFPNSREDLWITLEEAYCGCRQVRQVITTNWSHPIDVWVQPGCLAGSEKGPFCLPDGTFVTYVVRERSHRWFRREGSDLIYTHRLPLRDALLGANVEVTLFTGELLRFVFDQPVHGGITKRVEDRGFPLPSEPWKRGAFILKFDVVFPETVPSAYHDAIRQLLHD